MKQITGHTGLTGLFGSPVAHSISPMMHNASFEHLGLDYVYLAFDVGTDKLAAAVDGLRAMNVRGFNLTMPDKNKMCELCDRLSPAAEISQAVNTVVNDNGILTGHTTDGTDTCSQQGCRIRSDWKKDDTSWRRRSCHLHSGSGSTGRIVRDFRIQYP